MSGTRIDSSRASLRTLQRRVRDWRAHHGPDQEVFFEQTAVPGREAAVDFTDATDLAATIAAEPFEHLWFEWVLSAVDAGRRAGRGPP